MGTYGNFVRGNLWDTVWELRALETLWELRAWDAFVTWVAHACVRACVRDFHACVLVLRASAFFALYATFPLCVAF